MLFHLLNLLSLAIFKLVFQRISLIILLLWLGNAVATQGLLNQVKSIHSSVYFHHDLFWYNLSLHPHFLPFSCLFISPLFTARITWCIFAGLTTVQSLVLWNVYFKPHSSMFLESSLNHSFTNLDLFFGLPFWHFFVVVVVLYLRPCLYFELMFWYLNNYFMNNYLSFYVA